MRVVAAVLLFLALAADARADAWVPTTLGDHRVDPLVAADGTTASTAFSYSGPLSLVVLRPGQAPTAIDLAKEAFEADTAVAPGGWVAVAWTDGAGRMQAAVHRPDGTVSRRVLDRGSVSRPVIGIDGTGRTLVGWVGRQGEEDTEWVGRWAGGTVGGAWGPGTLLSSPVRDAHTATPVLDPAGNPEVVWDESGVYRAARHDLGAQPDTVPLVATAELSARGTRVTARVRCSKACDAGLSLRDGSSEARAIRATRTTTVRLRIERKRRVRVTLVVADRAGHTKRWTRTVRVR